MDLQKGDEQYYKFHCRLSVSELRYFKYVLWYPKSCEWLLLYIILSLLSLSLNIPILLKFYLSNGNRTEWSPIRAVIVRVLQNRTTA